MAGVSMLTPQVCYTLETLLQRIKDGGKKNVGAGTSFEKL